MTKSIVSMMNEIATGKVGSSEQKMKNIEAKSVRNIPSTPTSNSLLVMLEPF